VNRVVHRLGTLRRPGGLGQGIAVLIGGTAVGQLIVVASSPLLTRLYSPTDLGTYSVAAAILVTLTVVSGLCYQQAIPLPESDVLAANILAVSLVATLGISVLCGLALWVAGPGLMALLGVSSLSPYVLPIALGQMGGGGVLALTLWAIRTKSFSDIAATRLTQSGSLVAAQLGLGALGLGAPGLLIGSVVGSLMGSGRLARGAWRTHAPAFRQISWRGMAEAATRYRRFPIFATPSNFLNTLGLQAPLLLMVGLYGPSIGGQFALATRIGALPVGLVAAAVGQVFTAEAARLAREEPAALIGLFWKTTRSTAFLAFVPFVLLALGAYWFAPFVFGDSWRQAGLFVAVLTPLCFMQLVMSPTSAALDVLERQDLNLIREIVRSCLTGGAVAVAAAIHLSSLGAVVALSFGGCVVYALYGLTTWYAIVSDRRPATSAQAGSELVNDPAERHTP
jgi:O-antigen/teichoic acid export membrane protein